MRVSTKYTQRSSKESYQIKFDNNTLYILNFFYTYKMYKNTCIKSNIKSNTPN